MDLQNNNKLPEIAFIVGMGRSGTTLLTNILNSHNNLISTPENEFMLFTYSSFRHKKFNSLPTIQSFITIFNYNFNKESSIWKPLPKLKQDIITLNNKNFGNVCKSVYVNYPFIKDKQNITCIIDKNPIYSLYINKLNKVFPSAKYIVLVRDFRDNILSRKTHAKSKSSIFDLANSWNFYYEKIFSDLKKNKLNYHLIRYEDLVSHPKETLTTLCQFLEIDYSNTMLGFQGLSTEMMQHVKLNEGQQAYKEITQMHANLKNQINATRVRAYEQELSTNEITISNYICNKLGKEFNYIAKGPTEVELAWRLHKMFSQLKIKIYYLWRSIYYSLPISIRLLFLNKKTTS
ncbi:MAG TPA: sulfotransferase [Bacteroidia bacterium]|nr:sulfotransferase [Bacteroidia bacterium]